MLKTFNPPPLFSVSTCYCNLMIKGKKLEDELQREKKAPPEHCISRRRPPAEHVRSPGLFSGGQPRTASTPSQPTEHRPAGPLNGQDGSSKPQMDSLSSCTSSQPSSYPAVFITGKDARGWDCGSRCSVPFWLLRKRNRILTRNLPKFPLEFDHERTQMNPRQASSRSHSPHYFLL